MTNTPRQSNDSEQLLKQNSSFLSRAVIAAALVGNASVGCNAHSYNTAPPSFEQISDSSKKSVKENAFLTPQMKATDQQNNYIAFNGGVSAQPAADLPAEATHGPVIETREMLIRVKRPNGPWPKIPKNCAYTGIVREHHTETNPHYIVLENMCYRDEYRRRFIFDGESMPVEADKDGHYDLPFRGIHLEEQGEKLYLVVETRDQVIKELLGPGEYAPNTLSFEHELDTYAIESIR